MLASFFPYKLHKVHFFTSFYLLLLYVLRCKNARFL
nr:MAG TPA: hypothetical protein [Caudoviricetes sp.]